MKDRIKEQPKSRKVKFIIEEVIMDTLLELVKEDEMLSLKAESIFNKISNKKSIKPYISRDVVRLEEFTSLEKKQYRADRILRIKRQPVSKISDDEFKLFHLACKHLKLDESLIRTTFKETEYTDARKMIGYIFHTYFKYSLTKIAKMMNRDHSTIVHSNRKHKELMSADRLYARKFYELTSFLREAFPEELGNCKNEEDSYIKSLNHTKEKNYKVYIKKLS